MEGILGTAGSDARLASDLTLLAYIFLIVPAMLVGFVFARRKMFRPYHKYTMTAITLTNWVIIIFLMLVSYRNWVAPFLQFGLNVSERLLPMIYLVTGAIAQLLATYLVILMWTERTRFKWVVPKALQIQNIKPYMRMTLALWLVTAALGVTIFLTWYPPSTGAAGSVVPVATEEPLVATDEPIATEEATPAATEEPAETPEAVPGATEEPAATPEP